MILTVLVLIPGLSNAFNEEVIIIVRMGRMMIVEMMMMMVMMAMMTIMMVMMTIAMMVMMVR